VPARVFPGGRLNFMPWAGYIAGATFAIPVLFAWRQRVGSPPLRVIAAYCVLGFVQSMYLNALALEGRHNLEAIHLFIPVQATMMLWALALWQVRERERLTVAMIIPIYLIVWVALTMTVESFATFPRYVKIVEGLLVISVAAFTLVARSQHITSPVSAYPWFWACSALVMYLSFGAIVNPVSSLLLPYAPARVLTMSSVNAVLLAVCNLMFAKAMAVGGSRVPHGEATAAA
jgi:hypothetical protein